MHTQIASLTKLLILSLSLLLTTATGAAEAPVPATVQPATKSAPIGNPQVVIKTSEGDITLVLFRDKAPITVDNFLQYADAKHFDGTIFHRVIKDFMIQGGGYLPNLTEVPVRDPIVNESKNRLHNTRGTIAMGRTNHPDSAAAQFFINQANNLRLDWSPGRPGYTVFGEVVVGMSIVDFIASAPTGKSGHFQDVPVKSIVIHEVRRLP